MTQDSAGSAGALAAHSVILCLDDMLPGSSLYSASRLVI